MYLQYTHLPCSCCQVSVWWVNSNLLMMLCMCPSMGQIVHVKCYMHFQGCIGTEVVYRCSQLQNSWIYPRLNVPCEFICSANQSYMITVGSLPWCGVTAALCNAQRSWTRILRNTYQELVHKRWLCWLYPIYGVWTLHCWNHMLYLHYQDYIL